MGHSFYLTITSYSQELSHGPGYPFHHPSQLLPQPLPHHPHCQFSPDSWTLRVPRSDPILFPRSQNLSRPQEWPQHFTQVTRTAISTFDSSLLLPDSSVPIPGHLSLPPAHSLAHQLFSKAKPPLLSDSFNTTLLFSLEGFVCTFRAPNAFFLWGRKLLYTLY